jgi:hypothetical protein
MTKESSPKLTTLKRLELRMRSSALFYKHRRTLSIDDAVENMESLEVSPTMSISDPPQIKRVSTSSQGSVNSSPTRCSSSTPGPPKIIVSTELASPSEHLIEQQESTQKELARKRSRTMGSIEGDLYRKRSGSLVKTLGGILKQKTGADAQSDSSESVRAPTPEVTDDDTHASYVAKLLESGLDSEIPALLACAKDVFMNDCITVYMNRFDFSQQPLDIALRRFLLECELPKETQQIDRVLDAFSEQYYLANRTLWDNKDQVYFLTFSLMLLQTDQFNTNNKKKMTKEEFVKNSRVNDSSRTDNSFLSKEIFEYFYDNITCAKFVQKQQVLQPQTPPLYLLPKRIFSSSSSTNLEALNPTTHRSMSISSTTSQFFNSQVDPYFFIISDQIHTLKLGVNSIVDENPFTSDSRPSFSKKGLEDVRDAISTPNGKYIRFDKDCNWLTGKTEVSSNNGGDFDNESKQCVRIIKAEKIWCDVEVSLNKFIPMASHTRLVKKEYYAMLTLCGLYIFENLNFLLPSDRDKLLQDEDLEEALLIDPVFESELKKCFKLANNGLFACQLHTEDDTRFTIFSTNKKDQFIASSFEDMLCWVTAINYIAALDSCHIDYQCSHREVLPIRSISLEDKVNKLISNMPTSRKKIDEVLRQVRHLEVLTPLMSRTRDMLIAYHNTLEIRIDWLWYEIERNEVYINFILHEQERDAGMEGGKADNESFLEDSFISEDVLSTLAHPQRNLLNIITHSSEKVYVE